MKKNLTFKLTSFALLKWDDCLSLQLQFELPVQVPVQLLLELELDLLVQNVIELELLAYWHDEKINFKNL